MSTPLDRLLSAARSAVQHVRGRSMTEEPDYMDCLASALGQYEQAVRHPGYQVDIEPDTVVVEPCGQAGCKWCKGRLADAFCAGAEYQRKYVLAAGAEVPLRLPGEVGLLAAAAGYVEDLGR